MATFWARRLHGQIEESGRPLTALLKYATPSPDHHFLINFLLEINDFRAWPLHGQIPRFHSPSPDRRFLVNFLFEVNDFRAWPLHGQIPGFRRPSPDCCFLINFLLEIDDFRAWPLHGQIPGFRRPSPDCCFLINFLLGINDFRAWPLHGQIPGFRRPSPDRRFLITGFSRNVMEQSITRSSVRNEMGSRVGGYFIAAQRKSAHDWIGTTLSIVTSAEGCGQP